MALVAGRVIEPGSRLSLARAVAAETRSSTLGEELNVVNAPVESFYAAMDWLLERQAIIEKKLAKRHLADGVFGWNSVKTPDASLSPAWSYAEQGLPKI